MGMYTELVVACRLTPDIPAEALHQLKLLILEKEHIIVTDKSGKLWPFAVGNSTGFPCQHATFEFDEFTHGWNLDIRMSRKGYCQVFDSFLRWLRPYVAAGSGSHDLFAWTHYEEDRLPTFYFLDEAES